MGKKLNFIFIILLSVYMNLYPAGRQLQLNNGMWQAVGFIGAYSSADDTGGYDDDTSFEFYDVADDNTTWVALSNTDDTQLIYNGATAQTSTYGATSQLYSVIGLFAIINQRSKKPSNFTILDGSVANSVKMKINAPFAYRNDIPMYRMYVEGQDGIPAFRLDFQANYQGQKMRVRFGDEEESYITYFNYENTFDNPAILEEDTGVEDGAGTPVDIVNVVDFNLSDNNLTQLFTTSDFTILTSSGGFGSFFRSVSADAGNRIEVYSMTNASGWKRFDTENTISSSNTLTQFTPGRGYWVRATSQEAHDDGNYTKIGMITKDSSDINSETAYSALESGWNMLSFVESDLRYAPTGMFIPRAEYTAATATDDFRVYFNRHASDDVKDEAFDQDNNHTRGNFFSAGIANGAGTLGDTFNFVKILNVASIASNLIYGEATHMIAFPAMTEANSSDDPGVNGVIILADNLFEIYSNTFTNPGATQSKTLTGNDLAPTSRGHFSSVFGEFMMAVELNDFNGTDINASLAFNMPSYSSTESVVYDLNDSNRTNVLTSIVNGLEVAATRTGSSSPDISVAGFWINPDINNTQSSSTSLDLLSFPKVLLAAGARFSIADRTITRVYKFNYGGNFKVVGPLGASSVSPVSDKNITRIINGINGVTASTGVIANNLGVNSNGDNFFMITSSSGSIRLEEDHNATLFTDINLDSSLIPAANSKLTEGMALEIFGTRQLLDRNIFYDLQLFDGNTTTDNNTSWSKLYDYGFILGSNDANGTANANLAAPKLSADLRSNAVWVPDFPINRSLIQMFAEYDRTITSITSQRFSHDNVPYYDFLDLTKDPDDWFGNDYDTLEANRFDDDYQGIFHIYPNQNYWVKLEDKSPSEGINAVMSDDSSIVYTANASFSNGLSDGVGVTQNHINHTLSIKFDANFIDPLAKDYYNVVAIIGGVRYYLRENGGFFTLSITDLEMNLNEKTPEEASDPIFINAYDGLGNILKEENIDNPRFNIYFKKPPLPVIGWDDKGKLIVTNQGDYEAQIYTSFISDIASERDSKMYSDFTDDTFGWTASDSEATYGLLRPIRIILKDPEYNLYSDMQSILYAPLYDGHVLEVTEDKQTSNIPYSYNQKQFLTNQEAGSEEFDVFDGSNGVNNGVQMTMLRGASLSPVRVSYYPEGPESQRRIEQFGGSRTMYISLTDDDSTNDEAILAMTYLPGYEGKMFYLSFNQELYQGIFQGNDNYNSDGSAYEMSENSIEIDNVINSQALQIQESNTFGFKVVQHSLTNQPILDLSALESTDDATPVVVEEEEPAADDGAAPII